MADAKKPVDLDGLGAAISKIKEDYAKKSDIPSMNYATEEEILALFDDDESIGNEEEAMGDDEEPIGDDDEPTADTGLGEGIDDSGD